MVVNKHVIYLSEEQLRTPTAGTCKRGLIPLDNKNLCERAFVVKEHGTLEEIKEKQCDCSTLCIRVRTLQNLARVEGRGKTMESLKRQTKDTISVE